MTNRHGSILIFTALLLTVLMGVTALAVDFGNLSDYRHRMQSAADAAAVAGAREIKRNAAISNTDLETFVYHDATNNGFTNGTNGIAIIVNHGPTSGTYNGNAKYVEVRITRPVPTFFMGLFGRPTMNVAVRAVAGASSGGVGCVYALSTVEGKGFETSGSGSLNLDGCDIYVNASGSTAFCTSSGFTVSAEDGSIEVVGDDTCSAGIVTPTPTTNTGNPVDDPFADVPAPTVDACTPATTGVKVTGGTVTLYPGSYCGDIIIQGGTTTFSPGLYVISDGGLIVKSDATVIGVGVTFYIPGTKPSTFINTTHVNLSAPTTGDYAGILMFGRGDKPSNSNVFNSDDQQLNGAIYFPHQHIEWKGNGGAQTVLVSDTIKFTGGSSLSVDFAGFPGGSVPGSVSKAE